MKMAIHKTKIAQNEETRDKEGKDRTANIFLLFCPKFYLTLFYAKQQRKFFLSKIPNAFTKHKSFLPNSK